MSNKERGVLTKWDDAKGFGFIKPSNSAGIEIFIHISEINKRMSRRPLPGDIIYYQVAQDARTGKPRACDAHLVCAPGVDEKQDTTRNSENRIGSWLFYMTIIMVPVGCSTYLWKMKGNFYPLAVYMVASLITVLMYRSDKRRAQHGGWRISEARLHFFELLGGWPGGLVAQRWFRHKTRKVDYQFVFWLIVFLHLVGWVDHLAFNGELRSAVGRFVEKTDDRS